MATGAIHQVEGSKNSIEVEELTRFAVDEHNKKQNTLLEFKKVTSVKEQVVYEAKVWVKPWMKFKEVQEFKLVGDA